MNIQLTAVLENGQPRRSGVPTDVRQTLNIPQGTDAVITVRVITPNGAPVDLTGSGTELLLTIKKNPKLYHDSWPRITRTAILSSGGVGTFQLEPGDTHGWAAGLYAWDVWLTKDGSRDAVIQTSPLNLLQSVAAVPARPPPPTLELVSNDTEPLVLDFSGTDISTWDIEVHIGYSTPLVKVATIVDGPGGIAHVNWVPGDLIAGKWAGEVQITKLGPIVQTSETYLFDIREEIA